MIRNLGGQVVDAGLCAPDGTDFGGAVSVFVTKDNGAQAAALNGAATSKGNGLYAYVPLAAETDAADVIFSFVAPGAVSQHIQCYTSFPQTGDAYIVALAISALATAINAKTTNLPADPASQAAVLAALAALNNLSPAQVLAQVNAAMGTTLADSIPLDGTAPSAYQALYILVQYLLERSVAGTTVSVKKPDGITTLLTLLTNSATAPTSISRSS